ncbi:permease [Pseudodesulfovibrio karagichevae]|uniref:Permease n=1 Tax=Pseudodesulfovibrio karagichevae TaxID=3239305 RepID=A0ABV4K5C2_9BACT
MKTFFTLWNESAVTSLGLFWTAFWAFGLGYLVSSLIQVFVTRSRMKRGMGTASAGSVAFGTFFGFLSSSCSFAALSTTRSLFAKGAGLVPALAFMLSSTNLVVELGIIIALFLSWQFVVGEYLGGVLLIAFMWAVVALTLPDGLEEKAREHARERAGDGDGDENPDWRTLIRSPEGWLRVARRYGMEWDMVWKDVAIGFTVAGIIATFVPRDFFQTLFIDSGAAHPAFWQVLAQALVGPVAAFFTFIGSMGNVPLAAVLFTNGVSFAGVMAFLFSDLVVFPVVRIQAGYYGWKMALYLVGVLLLALVATSVVLHYGFAAFDMLPRSTAGKIMADREFFAVDYTMFLDIAFAVMSGAFWLWKRRADRAEMAARMDHASGHGGMSHGHGGMSHGSPGLGDRLLFWFAMAAFAWLAGGVSVPLLAG